MTLTLDLQTLFKVTVHPLPKGTLWEKDEPDWARERENEYALDNRFWKDRRTEGWMDAQTDRMITLRLVQSRVLIKNNNTSLLFDYLLHTFALLLYSSRHCV